MIDIASKLNI
jgi:Zn-dependent peptidase ImmA (M78 family)